MIKHRLHTRFLACFLCFCLVMHLSLPVAAAQSEREDTTEIPQTETGWEPFEDVPVGDPAPDETGPPPDSGPPEIPVVPEPDETGPSPDDGPSETPETPAPEPPPDETPEVPAPSTTPDGSDPEQPEQIPEPEPDMSQPETPSDTPAPGAPGAEALPEAAPLADGAPAVLELDKVSYILIDSEEELRKIGSGDPVPDTGGLLDKSRKFTADEDYAIVADITLTGEWTPLDFCGTMIGAGMDVSTDLLGVPHYILRPLAQGEERCISQVRVVETADKHGVGFFGALYSKGVADDVKKDSGGSGGIIGGILGGLVGLVGGLLGTITGLLGDVAGLLVGWTDVTALGFEKKSKCETWCWMA